MIKHVEAVPPTFHARFSSFSRQYLYRIALVDKLGDYPVSEWRKCYFVPRPFCVEKAAEVCKLFEGTRNFASFCHGLNSLPPDFPTVRTVDHFYIKPGRPLFDPLYDPSYSGLEFYDFHIKSGAFMYKQVRRMVSVIVSVGQNRMTLDEVHQLFNNPGPWNSKASTAPPYGLYLTNVDYIIPQDELPQRSSEKQGEELATCAN